MCRIQWTSRSLQELGVTKAWALLTFSASLPFLSYFPPITGLGFFFLPQGNCYSIPSVSILDVLGLCGADYSLDSVGMSCKVIKYITLTYSSAFSCVLLCQQHLCLFLQAPLQSKCPFLSLAQILKRNQQGAVDYFNHQEKRVGKMI